MRKQFSYYVSRLFDRPKYIKTNGSETEIIQFINNKFVKYIFSTHYPTSSDEELTEITEEEYEKIRKQVTN